MNATRWALLAAAAAIALTLAQDLFPGHGFYHNWEYLSLLALAIVVLTNRFRRTQRGREGRVARRLSIGLVGAVVAAAAGLLSGLPVPDTMTVRGARGTVTPVLDLCVATAFSPADATTTERGEATVLLHRIGHKPLVVRTRPIPLEFQVVHAAPQRAAYVKAQDLAGRG